jgi:crossover junction endodeoxyribonuclease RusA
MSEAAIQREIRLTIPTPPSVNALYGRRKGGGVYLKPKYRAWKTEAGWQIMAQDWVGIVGPYTLMLAVPMIGDADNRIKAASDLLVSLGVTDDDRHCLSALATKEPGRKDCLVVIRPATIHPQELAT